MLDLLIVVFAAWYVAYILTSSHGPGDVFLRLREWRGGWWHGRHGYDETTTGRPAYTLKIEGEDIPVKFSDADKFSLKHNGLLDCPVCLAPWVALALLLAPMGVVTQALGVAGAAMILHGWSGWRFAQ